MVEAENGGERVFPERNVMMNVYNDKFPIKEIEYDRYTVKKGIDTSPTSVNDFLDRVVSLLTSSWYLNDLKRWILGSPKRDHLKEMSMMWSKASYSNDSEVDSSMSDIDHDLLDEGILWRVNAEMSKNLTMN